MNNMFKAGVALAVLMIASPAVTLADNTIMTTNVAADGSVDAGTLIGKAVVDVTPLARLIV